MSYQIKPFELSADLTEKTLTKISIMNTTIPIQISDLNKPEKAETFIEVFGRSTYNKAMRELSMKITGDGSLEKLMDMAEPLNPAMEEDVERYEKLRTRIEKESKRLIPIAEAVHELDISDTLSERLFEKREKAKSLLGERYYTAVFPLGSHATLDVLRKHNPNLEDTKRDPGSYKSVVKSLETKISNAKSKGKQKIDAM